MRGGVVHPTAANRGQEGLRWRPSIMLLDTEEEKGFACTVQNLGSDQSFLHPKNVVVLAIL